MKYEQYLTNGATVTASVTGRYIYLDKGDEIQVIANGRSMDIYRGFTFDVESEFTELVITQQGLDGDIALLISDVPFTAGVDGSKLNISADLEVSEVGVRFLGAQPVTLPDDQSMSVEVTNLPQEQAVRVVNMPEAKDVQKVHVVEVSEPNLSYVAHDTMTQTGTISANNRRKELLLHAAPNNQGIIWLGGYENRGYPLRPDGGFILSNGASLEVLIPPNCELYVSEVTA